MKWLLDFLKAIFGELENDRRNNEVDRHIIEAEKQIQETLSSMDTSDRDAMLERLSKNRGAGNNKPG